MLPNCQICNAPNPQNAHFWSEHHIKSQGYYRQYHPKKDLSTAEELDFKSPESWLLNDFKNKTNLKNYLKSLSDRDKRTYCKDLIARRKNIKDLNYSLSQVESKSLLFPSIQYLDLIFRPDGGYYKVCEGSGLKNKFVKIEEIKNQLNNINIKNIICDSREQQGLSFPDLQVEIKSLNYGDYTSKLADNFVYIERKSLADMIGTLSSGLERFKREIERAFLDNSYIIVVIEAELSKALSFNYLPYISRHTKASPEFIFSNLRNLLQNYTNIQFLFTENRTNSQILIPKILSNQRVYSKIDLQLFFDLGLL